MIYWIFGAGLLSLKQQKNKHKLSNTGCPASQYKESQLFLIGL